MTASSSPSTSTGCRLMERPVNTPTVSTTRAVFAWGRGSDGQLGLGDTADQNTPCFVDALQNTIVSHIACGSGHTVVLSVSGEVYSVGRGDDGRLGHGDNGWKYIPRLCHALSGHVIAAVTCGSYHTAAVTNAGDLYTWGGGMYGKLGHGNESGNAVPKRVSGIANVRNIACGSRHTVAVDTMGRLYSWGDREQGVSGHGDMEGHQLTPRLVDRLMGHRVIQVSACGFHTGCLTDTGECYTWGEGKFGRLGHGTEANALIPTLVEHLQDPVQISCGGFHTAVVTQDGSLFTFGGGEHGQLGHNDRVNRLFPTKVLALADSFIAQITCGWSHTAALDDKGQVFTWGNSDHGKLGHENARNVVIPQIVETLKDYRVVKVASYNEHTAALVEPLGANAVNAVPVTAMYKAQLKGMINDEEFSDVTFLLEHQPVYAHRAILAQRCEHFAAMFRSGMRESTERSINIPNIRKPVFLLLLEYIYTDAVEIDVNYAVELYIASDLYGGLERLKEMCETVVRRNLSAENAGPLLQTAAESHCDILKDMIMNFVIENFDSVTKTDGIKQLDHGLLLEILAKR